MFEFKINEVKSSLDLKSNIFRYGLLKKQLSTNERKTVNNIYIKSNNNCNLRCTYCFQEENKRFKEVNINKKVLKKILSSEGEIRVYGGEPFLSTNMVNLKKILELASVKSPILFYTNGAYESKFNYFLKDYQDKIKTLVITIDGDEIIHNKRRIMKEGNSFLKIMRNIKMCTKLGIPFEIQVNVDRNNINSLDNLIFYLKNEFNNVPFRIHLNRVLHTKYLLNETEFISNYIKLVQEFPNINILLNSITLEKLKSYISNLGVLKKRCLAGEAKVYDFTSNTIYTCPQSSSYTIGKIENNRIMYDKNKIEKIYNYSHKNNSYCTECLYKFFCKFGCFLDKDISKEKCQQETEKEIMLILNNFSIFFNIN